jgi:putative membrane protein
MAFSRVLTWMFQHYRMTTLALLSGFMIGSLPKIWPWRIPTRWIDESGSLITTGIPGEHARILSEKPVFPGDYLNGDPHTTLVIVSFLFGFFVILLAAYFEKKLGAPQHMA